MSKKNAYLQYTTVSYSGKQVLAKHSLTETGLWNIKGEDPNCDMGGHHYQPDLGTVEGTLKEVIEYAVDLPNFWAWGGGGNIIKVSVKKIDSKENARIANLRAEQADLNKRLKEINLELKELPSQMVTDSSVLTNHIGGEWR
jgi:hypothetical protein